MSNNVDGTGWNQEKANSEQHDPVEENDPLEELSQKTKNAENWFLRTKSRKTLHIKGKMKVDTSEHCSCDPMWLCSDVVGRKWKYEWWNQGKHRTKRRMTPKIVLEDKTLKIINSYVTKVTIWRYLRRGGNTKYRVNLSTSMLHATNESSPPSSASFVKTQTIPYLPMM